MEEWMNCGQRAVCCGCKAMTIVVVTSPCACSRPPLPGLQNGPVKPPRFGLDATRNWGKSGLPKPGDGAGKGGGGSILSLITFPQERGGDAGLVFNERKTNSAGLGFPPPKISRGAAGKQNKSQWLLQPTLPLPQHPSQRRIISPGCAFPPLS